jgi:uncharacterized membrane protein YqjE
MATEPIYGDAPVPPPEPGWRERLAAAWSGLRALVATRAELFREELAEKQARIARGMAGLGIAAVFGLLASLLLTALIAVLLSLAFGRLWAGLAAALVLYLAVAGLAARFGIKALSGLRLFDFPATREEIRKDVAALRRSASPGERVTSSRASPGEPREDLEERFREGSE